jgi:hypothetical protein
MIAPSACVEQDFCHDRTLVALQDHRFAARRLSVPIPSPERRLASWTGGLALSRDRRWLFYSQIDRVEGNLQMIENFR